ncbi:hypothetical protein UPYG_G00054970 [Umbra pygmaea]|uniref:C2H2-type domain-containing protein n=1 Tax=Umbra pygmaea TaxID=75934 RepID=A0ABD0XQ22_UMBPY
MSGMREKLLDEIEQSLWNLTEDNLRHLCERCGIAGKDGSEVKGSNYRSLRRKIEEYCESDELMTLEDQGMSWLLQLKDDIKTIQEEAGHIPSTQGDPLENSDPSRTKNEGEVDLLIDEAAERNIKEPTKKDTEAPPSSTDPHPTLTPGPNSDPRARLGSLRIVLQKVVVVKEEEDAWDCYVTGDKSSQASASEYSPSTSEDTEQSSLEHSESEDPQYSTSEKPERRGRKHKIEKTHSCLDCGKKFVSLYTLKRHQLNIHTGEKKLHTSKKTETNSNTSDSKSPDSEEPGKQKRKWGVRKTYSCPECGKHCKSFSAFKIHKRTHTGEKPYLCSDCGKGFTYQSSLRIHQKKDPAEKITCCCGQEFSSKCVLEAHLKTATGPKPYTCCVCGKNFRKESLKEHQRSHTGETPYTCQFCGKVYCKKPAFKAHERTHTEEKPVCTVCGRSCSSRTTLLVHLRTHTGEKPYLCSECGKGFFSKAHLTTHQRYNCSEGEERRRAKPFHKCPDCGKEFTQANKLERHMRTHTGERPYQCSVCGMRFNQKGNLKTHFKVHTGGDPSLLADMEAALCLPESTDQPLGDRRKAGRPPRCLDQRDEEETHNVPAPNSEESQNPREPQKNATYPRRDKNLLCPECGKTYPREYDLKVHLRTHTGERPYQCDECGKTFVRKQGLRQHRRSHAPKPMGPTRQLGRPPSMGSSGKRTNHSSHRIGRAKQQLSKADKCVAPYPNMERPEPLHAVERPMPLHRVERPMPLPDMEREHWQYWHL